MLSAICASGNNSVTSLDKDALGTQLGSTLKGKNLLLDEQILSPIEEEGRNITSTVASPDRTFFHLSTIAIGLSECKRVKQTQWQTIPMKGNNMCSINSSSNCFHT